MPPVPMLLALTLPLLLQSALTGGPEIAVAPPHYEPPIGIQSPAVVLSDGTDFLVAWSDTSNVSAGLYVAKVTEEGDVRPLPQQAVSVTGVADLAGCWTGNEYLLVWNDASVQAAVSATFSRDGDLLATPRRIAPEIVRYSGALACASGVALIAYRAPTGMLYTAMLGEDGGLVREYIGGWPVSDHDPQVRIASDGRDFALFIGSLRQPAMYSIARIRGSGDVVDVVAQPLITIPGGPFDVAYGGGHYALASSSGSVIRRVIIDPVSLQTTAAEPIAAANTFGASVLWSGSEFIAYWLPLESRARLRTLPFSASNLSIVEPATPVTRPASAYYPHLATNGRNVLAVWRDTSLDGGGGDVAGVLLDRRAVEPAELPTMISMTAAFQAYPGIASSESESVVAWHERRPSGGAWQLMAARLTHSGRHLQQPVTIATGADPWPPPTIVYTGETYLVFWSASSGTVLFSRTFGKDGSLGEPVHIPGATRPYAAAAARGSTLLAFVAANATAAVRLTPGGAVIDTVPLVVSKGWPSEIAVGSNGKDFLVVYGQGSDWWQHPSPNMRDVFGVRVSGGGTVLDATPLPIASTPANEAHAAVASDGRDYLVLYAADSAVAKRVTAEGGLASGTHLPSLGNGRAVAWRGDEYIVASQTNSQLRSEVRLTRLDRSGTLIEHVDEPMAVTGVRASPLAMSPALAAANGTLQIVYVRRASGPEYGDAARVFFRSDAVPAPRRRAVRP